MKQHFSLFFLLLFFCTVDTDAQSKKFDSTVKMGDKGYRVQCNNKNADKNEVTISPIGLKTDNGNPSFTVYGRILKIFSDDMNDDGLPDLIICVYNGDSGEIGSIVAIAYNADKTFAPIYFPDIYLDSKIRDGYKGHDEFSDLTGTLLRQFPIYLPTDAPGKPTGGTRVIQYKAMSENGRSSFKALRWYDKKP